MIPIRTMKGSCEISTAALTLTSQPPAFQGEAGALQVQVDFTLDGSAFSPDASTEAQVYLYYPASDVMTQAQTMAISGNTATATLSAEDQATPGAPYLVVQLTDTSSGALIVSCMAPLIIRQTRADTLTNGTAPNPSEVVYVGRAPYLSATNTWVVWDNTSSSFVDSGISAIGPEGPQGQTGPQGETGATGATPNLTIGSVTTGAPGTDASVTITGTPEDPVLNLQIPRGNPGAVQTVNGNEPDEQGNAQVDGLIYETTAQALEAMSQEQQATLYAQGYRAIKTENNGTVVLLGLASDGSLEWLGCNQPRGNLLDNSDFVHPINQRGETSKQASWEYWIDRWLSDTEKTAAQLTSSGIHLPATAEKNLRILQRVPLARIKKGQSYTIAAYDASGNVLCVSGVFNGGMLTGDGLSEGKYYLSLQSGDNSTYYYCILDAYADITVKCMALYEGEYTAETLPPYVPKGYAAELAECLRYYRRITATNETFAGYCANGVSYCMIPLQTMRIKPSLVPSGKFYYTLGNKQGTTTATATAHSANVNRAIIKCAITETGILTGTISPQGDIDISADL